MALRKGYFKQSKTYMVGRSILRKEYKDALILILTADSNDEEKENVIRQFLEDWECDIALERLSKRFNIERSLISALKRDPKNHLGAIMTLDKTIRSLYLHSFQSYVWNKVASKRTQREVLGPG